MICCPYCFCDLHHEETLLHYIYKDSALCGACRKQLHRIMQTACVQGLEILMLYEYNEFFQSMIFQYKEARDIALKHVFFFDDIKRIQRRYKNYAIVLLPSSKEKMMERGFLPVKEMLKGCKLEMVEPFYKASNHKQSLQSMEKRKAITSVIKRNDDVALPKKPLLIIDDVCTSGSSLLHAYQLLQPHVYAIRAIVLSAHPYFLEQCQEHQWMKNDLRHRERVKL